MNPKLVWHIFRTDARHLRWLIAVALLALAADAWPYVTNTLWDLPLAEVNKRIPYRGGYLHCRVVGSSTRRGPLVDCAMQGIVTGLAADPARLAWNIESQRLWNFVLYLPQSGELFIAEDGNDLVGRGPLLACGFCHRLIKGFEPVDHLTRYDEEDLRGARVLIFAPRILGVLHRRVVTPPILPDSSDDRKTSDHYLVQGPPIAPKDFFDYALPRRPDPATASDEEFGRWLLLCQGNHTLEAWSARELCEWLPGKSGAMLHSHPPSYGNSPLARALAAGLPESRKREVIALLPATPWLLGVVRKRGWLSEARREVLQLFARPEPHPEELWIAVASLEEPATYDQLLERIARWGGPDLYRALSRIPAIADRLDGAVKRYFEKVNSHGRPPAGTAGREYPHERNYLEVPLMHGIPEAMREALVLFHAGGAAKFVYQREQLAKHIQWLCYFAVVGPLVVLRVIGVPMIAGWHPAAWVDPALEELLWMLAVIAGAALVLYLSGLIAGKGTASRWTAGLLGGALCLAVVQRLAGCGVAFRTEEASMVSPLIYPWRRDAGEMMQELYHCPCRT